MTDVASVAAAEGAAAVRELLRRCGHELRNAQNAAAVNLEVVRSRVESGRADTASLQSFTENAAKGLEDGARLSEELVALCAAIAAAFAAGQGSVKGAAGSGFVIELPLASDAARALAGRVAMLAERAGFGVEAAEPGVILRIPPDNETNRA